MVAPSDHETRAFRHRARPQFLGRGIRRFRQDQRDHRSRVIHRPLGECRRTPAPARGRDLCEPSRRRNAAARPATDSRGAPFTCSPDRFQSRFLRHDSLLLHEAARRSRALSRAADTTRVAGGRRRSLARIRARPDRDRPLVRAGQSPGVASPRPGARLDGTGATIENGNALRLASATLPVPRFQRSSCAQRLAEIRRGQQIAGGIARLGKTLRR